jgi:hypothetical protein
MKKNINRTLIAVFASLNLLCFSDEKKPDPDGDFWNKKYERDLHKLNAYRDQIAKLFKDENADVLLPVLTAIEEGAFNPKGTKLESIKKIFGENEVKKINDGKYYIRLQKGKGRKSYIDIGGGFVAPQTYEWYLVCHVTDNAINSFDIHYGLESNLIPD